MPQFIQYFRLASKDYRQVCGAFRSIIFGNFLIFLITFLTTPVAASAEIYPVELERQSLRSALNKLSEIANFPWGTVKAEYVDGETVGPIYGYYTARQVVAKLLNGTGIQYKWVDNIGLSITGKKTIKKPYPSKPIIDFPAIEEMTVIGSHIRGSNSAAPVFEFNRKDIQNSGLVTTQEFLNSLPQVFGGGAMEGVITDIKGEGAGFNIADACGVNLLGLGFDSTLVLLNGRRMAPVGLGDAADVSSIPLNAIERIDVMADGASAIYGSDAVSGVVNIILRRSYQGMETQVGYGDVTTGSNESYRFGHTLGKHWSTGSALLSYTYRQRARLSTEDRHSTRGVLDSSDILGENTQHNAVFSTSQQLTERADIYADIFYSTRETEQNKANSGGNITVSRSVKQYSLVGGGGTDFGDNWRMDTSIQYNASSTDLGTAGPVNSENKTTLDTWALDTKVDGEAFQVGGGAAKLALGGQYRREAFTYKIEPATDFGEEESDRNIAAVFTELFIPLVSESNRLPGLERLELTLAGRRERYSDFGSSTNPKAGLLWSPVIGLNFRATYSKSYRAPLLFELSEAVVTPGALALMLPDSQGETSTLIVTGYNADLQPEKAVNWTIGADIKPLFWPAIRISLTYFAIDFTDRIQTTFGDSELGSVLLDPRYEPVVVRNPDRDLIDFWASQPYFIDRTGPSSLSGIGAFIDNRLHNIAAVRERGLDFSLDYALDTDLGEFVFQLGGTYLLTLESQATEGAPFAEILNTPYNPVDIKMRNSISWRRNSLVATAFINYVGGYKDTRSGQERDIEAWTTVDFNIRYDIKQSKGFWLNEVDVSLSVNNLFDNEPPFVANEQGYNFDATNANAVGRQFFLEFTKRW